MQILLLYIFFFLPIITGVSNTHEFVLIGKIPITKNQHFIVDKVGTIYIYDDKTITCYNQNLEKQFSYNEKSLASEISYIDISNPFKILVFYKDISTIVFVDNTLSKIGNPIKLESLGLEQSVIAASSNNNGFWVFENKKCNLVKIDQSLREVQASVNLNQLLTSEINPIFLTEQNENIFLCDPQLGILMFDLYGGFIKILPIKNLSSFQVIGEHIFYHSGEKLKSYNFRNFAEKSIELPVKSAKASYFGQQKIYLIISDSLEVYSIKF